MKRFLPVVLLLLALLSSCGREGRVIPRGALVDIYADMLLADEWLDAHPECKRQSDTSAFYEPIFRKYGYTTLDYDASVYKYLRDPEKFSKLMVDVEEKLRLELNRLRRLKKKSDAARARNHMIFGYQPKDFELGDVPKIWEAAETPEPEDTTAQAIDTTIVKQDKIQEQCTISTDLPTLPTWEKARMNSKELSRERKVLKEERSF